MPGDYSRKTFDKKKHYSGVLMQQGRVQLDADWNEEVEIEQYRTFTETKDVIGASGVPKKNGGFKISVSSDGTDLVIAPGRIYVEGLLCELESTPLASYKNQPYYPDPDLSLFNIPGSPPASPAGSPPADMRLKDGTYLVYLKAWQRERNYLDDPYIQEKALGEADTTTRLQTVWQVRLLKVQDDGSGGCKTQFSEWDQLTAPFTGMLNVQTKKPDDNKDPCVLPQKAGYLRLENQLYRVEVQKVDSTNKAPRFKWSREDASVETIIENVSGKTLTVSDTGKDEILGFAGNQWVEIVDEISTLNGNPHPLVQIDFIDPDSREITLKTPVVQFEKKKDLKLRRWDMDDLATTQDGLPASSSWLNIEDGIQIMFNNGTFEPGDYWLIPARTATGNIEWPLNGGGSTVPQARTGIPHFYCRLAFAKVQSGVVTLEDCRPLFPTLTEICAEDICYNNKNCTDSTAKTVQEALDELCRKRETSCTFIVLPGPGWETVFDKIGKGKNAQICFQVGQYPLKHPIIINDKGNIKLIGCGPGSRITSPDAEAALVFNQCKTINIKDLYAESGSTDPKNKSLTEHLNGVFTFTNCEEVNIDHVSLKCGVSTSRTATCITVSNNIKTPCPVRIGDCDLQIGNKQQGILLVNITQCWVENNNLKVYETQTGLTFGDLLKNKLMRSGVRDILVSNARTSTAAPADATTNVTITSGRFTLQFKTDKSLKTAWQNVLTANPPLRLKTAKDLHDYVKKLADRIITDEKFRDKFPQFTALFQIFLQPRAVGSLGIAIGGQVGKDIYVHNNVIAGVLQGIHVGMSHATAQRQPDTSENLSISGNTISVILPRTIGKQDRYGIFVGNSKNLLVENNTIQLERINDADNLAIDGIRVWGILGGRLMITKNFLFSIDGNQKKSFDIGINVNPLLPKPATAQWVVMWNVAPSKVNTVRVTNGAVSLAGTNTP